MTIARTTSTAARRIGSTAALATTLLVAGCIETVEGTRDFGAGFDTRKGTATGNIAQRTDGAWVFTLTRGKHVCTARFDDPARAGGTELSTLLCTNGGTGTATVVYGRDATPDRVVYAETGKGGGTIRF